MTVPSPQARRISKPSWLDLRLVLGVVLVLACVAIGATVVSRAGDTQARVSATRDLAAGTVLRADDVRLVQVQLPDDGSDVYLNDLDAVIGKQLDRPVSRDELVPGAAVTGLGPTTRVTIPFAAGAAPGLRKGERIEVFLSSKACASVVLLPDVTVQDVRSDSDNTFGGGSGAQDVDISVAPSQSRRVIAALAIEDAQIRAGVLIGGVSTSAPGIVAPAPSTPVQVEPSTVAPSAAAPSGDAAPSLADVPADLAACVPR